MQVHANDLAAFIGALRLDPVAIVGWSYGAAVGLAMAVQHPSLVERLFLYEPGLATFVTDPAEIRDLLRKGGLTLVSSGEAQGVLELLERLGYADKKLPRLLLVRAFAECSQGHYQTASGHLAEATVRGGDLSESDRQFLGLLRDICDFQAGRITTGLWPGFPSDLVSLVAVLATQAEGQTLIHDWMYELRLFALEQLSGMSGDLFLCLLDDVDPRLRRLAIIVEDAKNVRVRCRGEGKGEEKRGGLHRLPV